MTVYIVFYFLLLILCVEVLLISIGKEIRIV